MNDITSLRYAIFVCVLCALAACTQKSVPTSVQNGGASQSIASAPATGAPWIANGATACDTYLTAAVVADILKNPSGHTKKLSPQACAYETTDFANISITLIPGGTNSLDRHLQYLPDPVPLAGVGDKAVRTMLGVEAAKGADRMCSIDVTPPFAATTSGEALAQKLGAICNQLFALP
jgi:hypothetical protein